MSQTLFDRLTSEITDIMAPLIDAVSDPFWADRLFSQLGVDSSDPSTANILAALQAVLVLKDAIATTAANPSPSFAGVAMLLKAAKDAFTAIRALSESGGSAAAFESLGVDLVQILLGIHVSDKYPLLFQLGVLLTLIEPAENMTPTAPVIDGDNVRRAPIVYPEFHLERLSPLIQDPVSLLRAEYVNSLTTVDDANAMADKLFPRVGGVLDALGVPNRYGISDAARPLLGGVAPLVDHSLLVYIQNRFDGADADAGVCLAMSSADRGDLGLVVSPFGELSFTRQAGNWALEFDFTAEVDAFSYGHKGFVLAASPETAQLDLKISATLAAPDSGPAFVFGSPTGSRLEIGGALIEADALLSETTQQFAVSAAISSSAIVIAAGDGDSFLQSLLPAGGLKATFDLGIAYSTTQGVTFKGAAGLDATFSVALSLGGVVTVPTVHLGLLVDNAGIGLEVSIALGASVGPVSVLVDRLGVVTTLVFPPDGGSLGTADLAYAFKTPSGAGLSIDAAGVTGGGFLQFDPAKHEYSGMLSLAFTQFALQAFGLITTGENGTGFSMLAMIDADFPPIPLGWGFTLNGVGGLLAVHRTASEDALRAAVKTGQLSDILFPKSPITNAPQVLSELQTLFPAAPGRFIFGPLALIGWGTPTVLTAAIAIVIELPEPLRILLLARVNALMPDPSAPLVKINMDALGVLDLGKGEFALDASLFDSRIVGYTISGDMALRAVWAAQREFLLAIGGFHPAFTPPAGFPGMKRITIDMPSGPVAKLRLAAYLAITSNSVQIGAVMDVFIGVSGFGLAGHLGFDALMQFKPFKFESDISGSVALMGGGDDLMSISLDATLSGPHPWHISGHFTIHIVFFDVGIGFSHSWGGDAPQGQIAAVDVGQLLTASLIDPRNWQAQLPAGVPPLVLTRSTGDQTSITAHPAAHLEVHQRIAPLDLDIACFGGADISGATRFAISTLAIAASTVSFVSIQDDFAPAQFFQLSDADKLARPSFEQHDAGVRTDESLLKIGSSQARTVAFETFFIDEPNGAVRTDEGVPVSPLLLTDLSAIFAVGTGGQPAFQTSGNRRFTAPGKPVWVQPPAFVLADSTNLTADPTSPSSGMVYSNVQVLLNAAVAAAPARRGELQIIATHEMVSA